MAALPSMITFGSLTPLPSQDQILALHGEFRRKASLLKPLIEAVRDLPLLWAKMTDQNPALGVLNGEAAIMKLEGLVSGPVNEHILDEKHNILIVPITILTHVTLYLSFLEHSEVPNHNSVLENVVAMGGVQGLCAGLLSAQAISSAQTVEDVVILSCTSLRLAFCIGAYVDANQVSINGGNGGSVTLAVRWNPPETLEDVKKILLNHPKVYLAAVKDERDITITAPAEAATTLQEDLSQNGLSFLKIGLNGRYHTSIHADIPLQIINACEGHLDPRFGSRELVRSNFDGQVIPRRDAISKLLESILVQHVNWYLTISTSAQCISQASEQPLILSIGGDTTTQSIKTTHHVVRVKELLTVDIFRDLLLN